MSTEAHFDQIVTLSPLECERTFVQFGIRFNLGGVANWHGPSAVAWMDREREERAQQ